MPSLSLSRAAAVVLSLYSIALLCSMSAMEFLSWTAVALYLVHLIQKKQKIQNLKIHPIIEWALFSFFVIGCVGLFINGTVEEQIKGIGSMRWIILLYVFSYWLQDPKILKRSIQILMGFGTFTACFAIYQHFTGIDLNQILGLHKESARMIAPFPGATVFQCMGFFGHHLKYGYSIIFVFTLTLAFAIQNLLLRKKSASVIYFLSAFVICLSLVWTYGRGVWASTIVGAILVGASFGKRAALAILVVVAIGTAAVLGSSAGIRDRASSVNRTDYFSNTDRKDLWRANFAMFKDHPIFGVGILRNEDLTAEYYEKLGIHNTFVGHAHNTYLNFLAMTGLPGAVSFLIFIGMFALLSLRLIRSAGLSPVEHAVVIAIFAGEIAFHVGGLTQCNFKDAVNNHLFIFMLATVSALDKRLAGLVGDRVQNRLQP